MKRSKMSAISSSKVIGTHSGTFQADEAMGVYLLRQTNQYKNSKVVRSRDLKVLEPLDIVIDVGGVYDHGILRYDHHQRDYNERFDADRCTKLSASGLVYRHYGRDVIRAFYPDISDADLEIVYLKLYDNLLQALDAIDTGVEPTDGVPLLYKDTTGLSSRVGRLNPRWNQENISSDERFEQAVELCGNDFEAVLEVLVESELPARTCVLTAIEKRNSIDESGQIICFESGGLPWKQHLYDLEEELKLEKPILFVLYTDQSGMWRVQAVTVKGQAFENRQSLPEPWRGVRDADLEALTKIEGCRFVHAAGFIGGASTFEGVLAMARASLPK